MRTSVVILNWNTRDLLSRFLPALTRSLEGLDAELVVADNASSDGSVEMLRDCFPELRVIALDRNYGFAGGYDRALEGLDSEYYVLINSDVDVIPGWLEPLVEHMDLHPACAVCGPKIHAMAPDFKHTERFEYAGAAGGYIDRYGYPFCRGRILSCVEEDMGQYDCPADLLWVSGACMMVRSSVWKSLDGLDERFFAHMEEIDFCWRARLAGYSVDIVPESVVWHLGGGTLPQSSPLKLKLNFRNNLVMLEKNLAATFEGRGMSGSRASRVASRRIFVRKLLDGCAALVYLLSFRPSGFRAVLDAHSEASSMKVVKTAAGRTGTGGYRDDVCILMKRKI